MQHTLALEQGRRQAARDVGVGRIVLGLAQPREVVQKQQRVGWHASPEGVFIARTRHVQALHRTQAHLASAAAQLAPAMPALDLLAEDLRLAQQALGDITGEFSADDLLGEIFSRFCIGK